MTGSQITFLERLRNPAFIVMLLGVWYTLSVTYSKVGETVEDQLEIKKELRDMHLEFDEYKIESIERHYEIELRIKTLETEIEYLKK